MARDRTEEWRRLQPVEFDGGRIRPVCQKFHRLKPAPPTAWEDRAGGAIPACVRGVAAVLRPPRHPQPPRTIQSAAAPRIILLRRGAAEEPRDNFAPPPRLAAPRIRMRFRTATAGRGPRAPAPVRRHPGARQWSTPRSVLPGCARFRGPRAISRFEFLRRVGT